MYTVFLAEKNSNAEIWSLRLNNIELIAGILAASIGIMENLNFEMNNMNTGFQYYLDTDADVSNFRLLRDIPEINTSFNTPGRIKPQHYGVWMAGSKRFYYNLFTFKTNSFFQGILTICNALNVDFRDYMYEFPFDDMGNRYTLQDYNLKIMQLAEDAIYLDDISEEERDNENLQEPLRKDY